MAAGVVAPPNAPTDSREGVIIGVVILLLTVTTCCVGLRFYTRIVMTNSVGWDDYTTVLALLFAIITGLLMCVMTSFGHGDHIWTISDQAFEMYLKLFYVDIVVYITCLGTVKTAILLQYLRIFTGTMRKITLWALVLIGMWSVGLILVSIFTCTPISGFWDATIEKTCIPSLPQWYINAAGNIGTDVVIFILPIPVLWKLHLPRAQRLSLIGVFCLGAFTCTISVIRIPYLNIGNDVTYNNVTIACWSITELCCGIIGSCLPTLRPILFRLFPALDPSTRSSGKIGSYHYSRSRTNPRSAAFTPGTRGNGNDTSTASHKTRGNSSSEELTLEDVEMGTRVARSTGGEKLGENASAESVMGLKQARREMQRHVPLQGYIRGMNGIDSTKEGLHGTYTTIQTGPGSRPGAADGIQVRKETMVERGEQ